MKIECAIAISEGCASCPNSQIMLANVKKVEERTRLEILGLEPPEIPRNITETKVFAGRVACTNPTEATETTLLCHAVQDLRPTISYIEQGEGYNVGLSGKTIFTPGPEEITPFIGEAQPYPNLGYAVTDQ
jgi:hypothetical protein